MDFFGFRKAGSVIGGCISTNYFLAGIGTVAAVFVLNKVFKSAKPLLVDVTKEMVGLKKWLNSNLAETREFWQDVLAEAEYKYKLEIEKRLEILQKQQEVLEKIKATF